MRRIKHGTSVPVVKADMRSVQMIGISQGDLLDDVDAARTTI